jgi:acetolactate decarboxylase
MKFTTGLACLCLLVIACNNKPAGEANNGNEKRSGEFYHYSIWTALVNKVYDGDLTVKEAKTHGDIGLGSYNGVDGELIMLDGTLYQVPSSGEVKVATDSMHIPYLNTTFFNKQASYEFVGKISYDSLRKLMHLHFTSPNFFYAFKIHGEFDSLKLGSLARQQKPYEHGLDSLLPTRPIFNYTNIAGSMVGFYCPDFMGDINVAGFHLHFLSDDRKAGGHVMEFTGKKLNAEMEKLTSYHFVLPDNDEFQKANLEKKFQYGKK